MKTIPTSLFQVCFRPTLLAAAIATAVSPVQANDWTGGTGNWSLPGNWSTGVPIASDNVFIDNGDQAASSVTLDISSSITGLAIDAGDSLSHINGADLQLSGSATNNGTWQLNGTSADTFVQFFGNQSLNGSGELVLGDDVQNRLISNNATITNGAGHTIRGGGLILNNSGGMNNQGTLLADGTIATVIDPNNVGFVNNGTMTASGAGGFELLGGVFTNNTSIDVQNGSRLAVNGSTLIGGTLTTAGTGIVDLENASTLNGVTLAAGGAMRQANGHDVLVTNGLTNNGTWSMNGTSADTFVQFQGNQTLGGSGELVLGNDPQNRIITNNTTLTQGADHTIRGGGLILNNSGGMINEGTILADAAQVMQIDPNGIGFVNNGAMTATGAGGFELIGGVFTNNTSIDVQNGSRLAVNGSTLIGGTLTTAGTGVVDLENASTLNGVTLAAGGAMRQANGHDALVTNGLTNNGTWSMNGTSADTFVQFQGNQTLGGSGELVLGNDPQNRIITNNTTLTQGADHTIRGGGLILNNLGGMINEGTILADGDQATVIDPNSLGFVNNGTMQATGSGGFSFLGGVFDNTGYSIDIADGSKLELNNGVQLKGGVLNTSGSGVVNIRALATLDGVTSNGAMVQGNGEDAQIVNGITNNGTWSMNGTSADTFVQFVGDQTLGGTGELVLGYDSQNRVITNNTTVTNGADHTIRGGGLILNNSGGMINEGTILADGAQAMEIDPNGLGFTNNGTMQATGSGGFSFLGGVFDNTGDSIDIADGSKLELNNSVQLKGGVLNTSGSGVVNIRALATLDGVTSNGAMVQGNGEDAQIVNGITNNGTWSMNGTSGDTFVQFVGEQTLGGSGELVLGNDPQNRVITNNTILTQGADHTIRGGGQLLNNFGGMINRGSIVADSDAVAITIDANGLGFQNAAGGRMRAVGNAGINILSDAFSNAGDVVVETGSQLSRIGNYTQTAGMTRVDGTLSLTVPASNFVDLQGGLLDGHGTIEGDVVNAGGMLGAGMASGEAGTLTIDGTFTQSALGTLLVEIGGIGQGATYDLVDVLETASLAGTLSVSRLDDFVPDLGETFDIMTAVSVSGEFDELLFPVFSGRTFSIEYLADRVRLTTTAVPVPAAAWLAGSALLGLAGFARRRRS